MENKKIIRGPITYYITETAVIVGINNWQFISYNIYNSPSRVNLNEFKRRIVNSKPNQYNTVIEQMDLARRCNLIGSGTTRPSWDTE